MNRSLISNGTRILDVVRDGRATYFDTNTDWIDPTGELRAIFGDMTSAERFEAVERALAIFPGSQAKAAVRNIAAEVEAEQLERRHGAAARRKASDILHRISSNPWAA